MNDLCKTARANAQAAYERLSQAEDELYKTNEQIHYAGQYLSTKEVQQQFAKAIFKKKFRAEHSKELDIEKMITEYQFLLRILKHILRVIRQLAPCGNT